MRREHVRQGAAREGVRPGVPPAEKAQHEGERVSPAEKGEAVKIKRVPGKKTRLATLTRLDMDALLAALRFSLANAPCPNQDKTTWLDQADAEAWYSRLAWARLAKLLRKGGAR